MYTIIDIETTGNGIKGNKITEISIFKFDGEKVIDEFTNLVNPQCEIPYFITGLTGIDNQMVANAPTFKEIADKVLEITKDSIFIAHSVNFDYGVIKEEFRQIGVDFSRKKLCTVRLSRKLIPGFNSYSLGKLCSSLSIPLTDRHRARGDARATVLLFKLLLKNTASDKVIKTFLNARSQEATLPPLLSKSTVNNLPSTPGVYYFKNKNGEIIYVGKAINIKKRVLGHFYDKSNHEIKLCKEIADIDFELSGSELLALLMESAAIKEHYPIFNRAQKKTIKQYAIFSYEDRRGILHLAFDSLKTVINPLMVFYNQTDCRAYLENLCDVLALCPKYCHLQVTNGACSHYKAKSCNGICKGEEAIVEYNTKVIKAIALLKQREERILLERKGRTTDEKAFVLMESGIYKGYGFIQNSVQINTQEDLEAHLIPQKNTVEALRIIQNTIQKNIKVSN
ncbi:exonuclease domain-containing protein [Croceitalea vernalis]|uniref:Exonuclease domain-containing protein n=1 Tax=Croceitalea vernalis TaxID=3075599 RepID=A0ABU3BJJ3_9FLAO|nr:exonuclease domain-containing protein [Croceitalea sp. P007]MDT0622323.1 exonuclease domain-containing protein [Croceitalea sp. P007]